MFPVFYCCKKASAEISSKGQKFFHLFYKKNKNFCPSEMRKGLQVNGSSYFPFEKWFSFCCQPGVEE
jgi:hypothetical protein